MLPLGLVALKPVLPGDNMDRFLGCQCPWSMSSQAYVCTPIPVCRLVTRYCLKKILHLGDYFCEGQLHILYLWLSRNDNCRDVQLLHVAHNVHVVVYQQRKGYYHSHGNWARPLSDTSKDKKQCIVLSSWRTVRRHVPQCHEKLVEHTDWSCILWMNLYHPPRIG